jgi:hypothetical protein
MRQHDEQTLSGRDEIFQLPACIATYLYMPVVRVTSSKTSTLSNESSGPATKASSSSKIFRLTKPRPRHQMPPASVPPDIGTTSYALPREPKPPDIASLLHLLYYVPNRSPPTWPPPGLVLLAVQNLLKLGPRVLRYLLRLCLLTSRSPHIQSSFSPSKATPLRANIRMWLRSFPARRIRLELPFASRTMSLGLHYCAVDLEWLASQNYWVGDRREMVSSSFLAASWKGNTLGILSQFLSIPRGVPSDYCGQC